VSDQLEAAEVDAAKAAAAVESPPPSRRRELLIAGLCAGVMAAGGAAAAGAFSSDPAATPRPRAAPAVTTSTRQIVTVRAVESVARERSTAILHHDRAAFLATVDPRRPAFRRRELRMFRNLRRVHFAGWSYTFDRTSARLPAAKRRGYHAPTWAPTGFKLRYRIAGFDRRPTALSQYPTFVKRGGRWYLSSLTDFDTAKSRSATDLWDYAPVHVIHRGRVLVLGPSGELPTMAVIAAQLRAAIPKVTAVWGRHWARRVVVRVPSTQHEMARIVGSQEKLGQIAALTTAEVSEVHGRPAPVGDRITINPANWPKFGSLGATIVLAHELTHVATRAATGVQTPKWLSEGFADYVGFRDTGVPTSLAAAELGARLRAGHASKRLPSNHDFRGGNKLLPQAYESAWLACRYLAEHYSQHKLVRFYRTVGRSTGSRSAAIADALHEVFGITPHRFSVTWRGFVADQLTP
jgi:hypothetical protein